MLASASFGLLQLQFIDCSVLKNRICLLKFVSFLNDYRLYVKKKGCTTVVNILQLQSCCIKNSLFSAARLFLSYLKFIAFCFILYLR